VESRVPLKQKFERILLYLKLFLNYGHFIDFILPLGLIFVVLKFSPRGFENIYSEKCRKYVFRAVRQKIKNHIN